MNFKELVTNQKFTLVASLPANRIDLAIAALEGGAQAIKVHMNVWHRASNNTFGSFTENKEFMKELIGLAGDIPVGLVPGGPDAFISNEERLELEEMGLKFFSSYAQHLPAFMMESQKLTKMVAIDYTYNQNTLDAVKNSKIEVLETSVMPGELYGTPLYYADLLRYSDLVAKTGKPVLVPTQKKIQPCEVKHLYEAGCKAVMIGAIVMGKESAEDCKKATTAFRNAVDAL
jgi:hypothetical protein